MIEDLRNYIENYYTKLDSKEIDKLINACHSNNYLLKFIILTIKTDINIISTKMESNKLILKNKKQLLEFIHKKRRDIIKEHGKKIGSHGLKKNYSEDTEELMEYVNDKYLSLVKNINIIDKIIKYLTEQKYNIEYSLKILERNNDISINNNMTFIEEYSN